MRVIRRAAGGMALKTYAIAKCQTNFKNAAINPETRTIWIADGNENRI
jgi:hypothetical protein